jgi:hypothetical protein
MRDYLTIGPTPSHEDCAQVGSPDYRARARRECQAFINQLRRQHGPEPDGAGLRVKTEAHDFGSYFEVACYYDTECPEAAAYALKCEGETPGEWDAEARRELAAAPTRPMTVGAVLAHTTPAPAVRWIGPVPTCDFCQAPGDHAGFIDGKTKRGPWATMCPRCHAAHGLGLGPGVGQEYDHAGVKVAG